MIMALYDQHDGGPQAADIQVFCVQRQSSAEMTQAPPVLLLHSKADLCHFARPHRPAYDRPKNIRRAIPQIAKVESG
ncbi:hypothetical protein [Neorhizobium sp. NCHU2750]|uniref:hypothetical protein n=1 Tax=Neorhizobium sp. NCHU2750 TaxID=1825976 RepID=UPI000E769C1E